MTELFLQLLRFALWGKGPLPKEISDPIYHDIYKIAREQTVAALIADSLKKADIKTSDDCAMITMKEIILHQRKAKKINQEVKLLANILNTNNIRYTIFKGQVVATEYPNPELRTSGDIDFYIHPDDFNKSVTLIEKDMQVCIHRDYTDKHYDFQRGKVRFEMHYSIETFGKKSHQEYFNKIVNHYITNEENYTNVEGINVKTFNTTLSIVILFKHLFNHFLVEGIGLRQFCDLALIINNNQDIDCELLDKYLTAIGYKKAFLAVGAMMIDYLGLEMEKFPFSIHKDMNIWGRAIFKEVMRRGNFGKNDRKNYTPGIAKSMETGWIAMKHCIKFFPLAPSEISHLIPKRIKISFKKLHQQSRQKQFLTSPHHDRC